MYSTWGELKRAETSWTVITIYPCFLCKVPGLHQDAGYHHAPCSALQLGSSLAQFTIWWSYVEPGESCHHLSVKMYSSITTGNIYWDHTFTLHWTLPVMMRTRTMWMFRVESYPLIIKTTAHWCGPVARKYHSSVSHAFTLMTIMTLHRTMKMKTFQPPVTGGLKQWLRACCDPWFSQHYCHGEIGIGILDWIEEIYCIFPAAKQCWGCGSSLQF